MGKSDLAARLFVMTEDATSEVDAAINRIARQMSANHMLQSGNFYITIKNELAGIYHKTVGEMSEYALRIASPSHAATLVRGGDKLGHGAPA